jgi:hypothetical protein
LVYIFKTFVFKIGGCFSQRIPPVQYIKSFFTPLCAASCSSIMGKPWKVSTSGLIAFVNDQSRSCGCACRPQWYWDLLVIRWILFQVNPDVCYIKVLSTNPSATILSRTLIVNFKRNDRLALLQYSIDSFHENILQYCPWKRRNSQEGTIGRWSPLLHKCGLVPQVGSTLGINRYEIRGLDAHKHRKTK